MKRYSVSDAMWHQINVVFPKRGTCVNNRNFFDAVLWIAKSGAPWRDLPPRFGKWNSVYQRFNRFSKAGIWKRVFELSGEEELRELLLDSTTIRVHQQAAGAAKKRGAVDW
ncbi:MAG: transposase [Chitinophagaceae bacterium]